MVEVVITGAFVSWQRAARDLLRRGVTPDQVRWVEDASANAFHSEPPAHGGASFVVPRRFVELAQAAATQPGPDRWAVMYRVLWRLVRENRRLLELADDPDVRALAALQPSQTALPGFELEPSAVTRDPAREAPSARPIIPAAADLGALASAAAACTA